MQISKKYYSSLSPIQLVSISCGIIASIGIYIHHRFGYSWISTSGHTVGSDDAFISFRYAENFAGGYGLVFNIGEYVEGYSNLLLVLLCSLASVFGVSDLLLFSIVVSMLSVFLTVGFMHRLVLASGGESYSATLICLIFALSPVVWANGATGLETVLHNMLFVGLLWSSISCEKPHRLLLVTVFTIALVLSRVDGFLLPFLISSWLLFIGSSVVAIWVLGSTVATLGALTLWRIFYYDDVIANTYYAKVSGPIADRLTSGIEFLLDNSIYNGIFALFTILVILYFLNKSKITFSMYFVAALTGYILFIGGDLYYDRFLLIPFMLLLVDLGIFLSKYSRFASLAISGIVIGSSMLVFVFDGRFDYQGERYDAWINLGKFLEKAPDDFVLAIDAAGKVPYFSKLPTIDMFGLNDRHIGKKKMVDVNFLVAHNKYDADYVVSRRPDIISTWVNSDLVGGPGMGPHHLKDYELRYLVNMSRFSREVNIKDLTGLSAQEKKAEYSPDFNYGVYFISGKNL